MFSRFSITSLYMNILYIIFNQGVGGNLLSDIFWWLQCQLPIFEALFWMDLVTLCVEANFLYYSSYFIVWLLIGSNLGIWRNCTLSFRRQVLQLAYSLLLAIGLWLLLPLRWLHFLQCLGGLGLMDPAFFKNVVLYFKAIHSLLNEQSCLTSILVVLKLQNASTLPEDPMITQISGSHPRVSDIWGGS